jgi:exonuclease III
MASPDSEHLLKFCSYNMHGFDTGLSMTRTLCKMYDIIMLQEHWLFNDRLSQLSHIGSDFACLGLGVSSMTRKASLSIVSGRPFGGVAILWRKKLSNYITLSEKDEENGKFIAILIQSYSARYLCLSCVYFPCLSLIHSDYVVEASTIIAFIDINLDSYPDAYHVISGDFNFSCSDVDSHGCTLFATVADYHLTCCDIFCKPDTYTYQSYHHDSLGQPWIDHFFISNSLYSCIDMCDVVDTGENLSDHLPSSCILKLPAFSNVASIINVPKVKIENLQRQMGQS